MLESLDSAVAVCLIPLATWIAVSGLDDLFVLAVYLRSLRSSPPPSAPAVGAEKPIAVFVPCWQEHSVIGDMLEHNISTIRYSNYVFFIGVYPNDEPTIDAVRHVESRHTRVRVALCPHDGPTSKADCLNWIYQRMLLYEEEKGARFDVVLTHDAEDLIDPAALIEVNRLAEEYGFIQLPVLPLETPPWQLTHGLYCDDFAECHTKDLAARQALGGFLPSSGVGTGYRRDVLATLAESDSNRVFDPGCLTEDYENGLRIHRSGFRQIFLPFRRRAAGQVATREYFPRKFRQSVRQRTRWVTGIVFQTWERHGWSVGARQLYWLLRDRKSLVGYPVSLLSNLVTFYGIATWMLARAQTHEWGLARHLSQPCLLVLMIATLALQAIHVAARACCSANLYGWRFAAWVPVRAVYGNWLNTVCTVTASFRYLRARLLRRPLVWVKTEHAYPSRVALLPHKRPLEEILADSGYLSEESLALARATVPLGKRLSEHLVRHGLLSEEELYEALSLQLGLALGHIDPAEVSRTIARALSVRLIREWNVLPVRIEAGNLLLVSPEAPSDELAAELSRHTRLHIRFQLVTPTNFRRLAEELL